jgi:flagellar hook-basal body complex protein FliE
MSNVEINRVLAQMRALNSELQPARPAEDATRAEFGEVLREAVDKVSEQQATAASMATAFEAGTSDASLAEVMVSMQKASISFQAMTEVRNKLIDAYHEVMNMPI